MLCYNSNSKVIGKVSRQRFFSQTIFFFLLVICHISSSDSTCAPSTTFLTSACLNGLQLVKGREGGGDLSPPADSPDILAAFPPVSCLRK